MNLTVKSRYNRAMHAKTVTGTNQADCEDIVISEIAHALQCSKDVVLDRPEVLVVRPEKNKILRKQIIDIVQELSLTASSASQHRWVVIYDADNMNQEAANALLKLLEEPPERTSFLLTAHSAARLLPTIRSRTAIVAATPGNSEHSPSELANASLVAAKLALISSYHESKTLDVEYYNLLNDLHRNAKLTDLAWLSEYGAYAQNVPNYRLLLEAWAAQGIES